MGNFETENYMGFNLFIKSFVFFIRLFHVGWIFEEIFFLLFYVEINRFFLFRWQTADIAEVPVCEAVISCDNLLCK